MMFDERNTPLRVKPTSKLNSGTLDKTAAGIQAVKLWNPKELEVNKHKEAFMAKSGAKIRPRCQIPLLHSAKDIAKTIRAKANEK